MISTTRPLAACCACLLLADNMANAATVEPVVVTDAIVVSAQKREEDLQEIPFSVSSVSGDYLKNSSALTMEDIALIVPGFTMTSLNVTQPQFFIRGIGSNGTGAGEDASVGVFVDEVYAGRGGAQWINFLDLESVEVLRGPQGSLYGRNVAGGAINMVSKKPRSVAEGWSEATYGRFERKDIRGAVGGPIVKDRVMGRLALGYDTRDGYITNTTTGSDNIREYENQIARGHLQFNLTYNTQLLLSADYFSGDSTGLAAREPEITSVPVLGAGFIPLDTPSQSKRTVELPINGEADREFYGVSARLDVDTALGTLTSISAWRRGEFDIFEDVSGYGLPILGQDETTDQLTQEIRLTSTDTLIEWTAGVYFLAEETSRNDITQVSGPDPDADLFLGLEPDRAVYAQETDNRSYAVFGQATLPLIVERLELTVGGRFTRDDKELELNASGISNLFGVLPDGPFAVKADDSFQELTGNISLAYHLSTDALTYFTASHGYKSGGFNGTSVTAADATIPFDPETADTVELGLRSEWLDNRLRVNGAVFYTKSHDLQLYQVRDTSSQFIGNAESAETYGIELEFLAKPTERLDLIFNFDYLHGEYDEFLSGDNATELAGKTLSRSPKYSWYLAAQYTLPLGSADELQMRLDYASRDELFITPENRPLDEIESYALLNARITYQAASNLSVSLFGKNLTDEEYKLHTFDIDSITRNNIGASVYGDPRTWGVTVGYQF